MKDSEAVAIVALVASYWPQKLPAETEHVWAMSLRDVEFTVEDATAAVQELGVLRKYRPSLAEIVAEAESQRRIRVGRMLAIDGDQDFPTPSELFPHMKPGFA